MITEQPKPQMQIPIVPTNIKRVAVAVDRDLYAEAKRLNIDMHTLFRMNLEEAVNEVKRRKYHEPDIREFHDFGTEEDSTKDEFFSAMVRIHDRDGIKPGEDTRGLISEGVKKAAYRAGGYNPGPYNHQGKRFSSEDTETL